MTVINLFDDPTAVEDEDPDREFTEEEMSAIESDDFYGLSDDYADDIFGDTIEIQSLDDNHRDDPFGWAITDLVDWDSMDYEGNQD